ncbi:MAG: serine hydrolase [Opitutaceae bacterium]|nr:serine hydrolase [Opitutaceae bacterium]
MKSILFVCGAVIVIMAGLPGYAAQSKAAAKKKSAAPAIIWPETGWATASPAEVGMAEVRLHEARDYALTTGGSGMITRHGRVVLTWGDQAQLYDLKSSSKAIGVTLLGVALLDGKVKLDDPAKKHHPTFGTPPDGNAEKGWIGKITLRHLATQTAGFAKPGGYVELLFPPGTKWHYSDSGPNWLAECITLAYGRDLNDVMFERVFTPLGIEPADIRWRRNSYRPHQINGVARREFGSGFSANVDAMARLGYLYLREGKWNGRTILPADFVRLARQPQPELKGLEEIEPRHGNASEHYGLLWWNNGDGTIPGLPRDAYWSWGLYDSLIVVIPSLDIVAARTGRSWARTSDEHYDVLKPFLTPIAAAVKDPARGVGAPAPAKPPYPPSPVIKEITWAPKSAIIRRARGSDNWPLTWADDDAMYGAYGDGQGFEPFVPKKLSMGITRISGRPADFQGVNVRGAGAEFVGDGRSAPKSSGMLMVDGVLYLLARNVDNAQIGWSRDHGATWAWAPWKFTTSFGCPTFLNFGKNYAGARDDFVYVYSKDGESAYDANDAMVLARVPKVRLTERDAYEFYAGSDASGGPRWVREIAQRRPVFSFPGNCYRGGISYNAALKRYLWCQILPHSTHPQGPRFQGGLGIYDAPEPWGPWTTAFYAPAWDVGPGETGALPTKWMSDDGRTMHLVFSGDDHFSVREAKVRVSER